MLKKLIIVVICIAVLGSIGIGCKTATTAETTAAATTAAAETMAAETTAAAETMAAETTAAQMDLTGKKLGFVNAGPDDYYAAFGKAFKALAESQGMTVTELNSDYKPEKELANVQDLIAKGVDAIAVITAGAAGSAATIKAANDGGVPIFFIAGEPKGLAAGTSFQGHVSDNFVIMGYQVGKWVAENYPDAKTVNIPGFLGQGPAEGEIVGWDMALEEAGMEPSFLTKSSEWQRTLAIPITQDLISSGREFDVIFACNEETAFGVNQVFEEQNVTGKIMVSCNGKEEGWQYIKDGKMSATSPNPPSLNADLSIQQIARYLRGEKALTALQIKPWAVMTKENLDQAIPWIIEDYLVARAANKFQWDLAFYEKNFTENEALFESFTVKLDAYMAK